MPIDIDRVISENDFSAQLDDSEEELSWLEKFIAGITTEAREIYEGAKNFAKNMIQFENGEEVSPNLIHSSFNKVYGWSQMYYRV